MWDYLHEPWGRINPDQMEVLWKEISAQPPGIILEVALQAAIKAYGDKELTRKMGLVQSAGVVTPTSKIKRGTVKDW